MGGRHHTHTHTHTRAYCSQKDMHHLPKSLHGVCMRVSLCLCLGHLCVWVSLCVCLCVFVTCLLCGCKQYGCMPCSQLQLCCPVVHTQPITHRHLQWLGVETRHAVPTRFILCRQASLFYHQGNSVLPLTVHCTHFGLVCGLRAHKCH